MNLPDLLPNRHAIPRCRHDMCLVFSRHQGNAMNGGKQEHERSFRQLFREFGNWFRESMKRFLCYQEDSLFFGEMSRRAARKTRAIVASFGQGSMPHGSRSLPVVGLVSLQLINHFWTTTGVFTVEFHQPGLTGGYKRFPLPFLCAAGRH